MEAHRRGSVAGPPFQAHAHCNSHADLVEVTDREGINLACVHGARVEANSGNSDPRPPATTEGTRPFSLAAHLLEATFPKVVRSLGPSLNSA